MSVEGYDNHFEGAISMGNPLANLGNGLLKKPGDKASAEITKSGRGVIKINTKETKYSKTVYPSTGTTVETKTTRKK